MTASRPYAFALDSALNQDVPTTNRQPSATAAITTRRTNSLLLWCLASASLMISRDFSSALDSAGDDSISVLALTRPEEGTLSAVFLGGFAVRSPHGLFGRVAPGSGGIPSGPAVAMAGSELDL